MRARYARFCGRAATTLSAKPLETYTSCRCCTVEVAIVVIKKRRPDVRALRCATGSLCFSSETAAAELASVLWPAAQTVLADFPVSACDARRSRREPVRGGANGRGLRFAVFSLGCKPLWYWPAGEAVRQYQSGLQGRWFL